MNQQYLNEIKEVTDEAIARGITNANELWKEKAIECLERVARERKFLTIDNVRDLVDKYNVHTHDKRAWGGIMKKGKSLGLIEPTGMEQPNKTGHGIPMQVWKSKIYTPTETLF
jgi:hypothetical protein